MYDHFGFDWFIPRYDFLGSDLHDLLYLLIIVAPGGKFGLAGIVHFYDEPAAEMFVDLFDSA